MGSFSIWHWLIVLLVVVLVFGTKKLKNVGSDLGSAVKGFKDGVKGGSEGAPDPALIDLANVASAIEGIQFTDATAGELTIRINLATLEALPDITRRSTVLRYDLLVYDPENVPLLCLYGDFTVETGVTR